MIRMQFVGGKEIASALSSLSKRANRQVTTDALMAGAEPIRKAAAARAPRRSPSPDMADNMVAAPIKIRQGETAAVAIGPARRFYYGLIQELGSVFHGPQPFLRPAYDGNISKALTIVAAAFWTGLAAKGISRTATDNSGLDDSAFEAAGVGTGPTQQGRTRPLADAGTGGVF